MLKKYLILGSVLCSLIVVVGCSSSSDSNIITSISGESPNSIEKALVCLDTNDNFMCDDEVSTRSLNDGSYTLSVDELDASSHRLLFIIDHQSIDSVTGSSFYNYYTLASMVGKPEVVSIYTTLLTNNDVNESDIKNILDLDANVSLLNVYNEESDTGVNAAYLEDLYSGMFHQSTSGTDKDYIDTFNDVTQKVLDAIVDNPDLIKSIVNKPVDPPLLQASRAATIVDDSIFQSIPVDASTMSFGIGMDEITRNVVSGAYCLSTPQVELEPKLAFSENSRNYLFRLIRSEKDLQTLLNIGGGLSLGNSVVEGSIEGRFIKEYRENTDAIFALIKAEYVLSGYNLSGVQLDDKYLQNDATKASFISNYESFRKACGDRFLQQITTGGAYYGLLKITTSDTTSKTDLQAQLDGKYGSAGLSVTIEGDLKDTLQESLKNTNVSIIVGSRGVSPQYLGLEDPNDQLIDNLDKFFQAANSFMTAISDGDNECYDDEVGPKKCTYTATFADYATISDGIPRDQTQLANLAFTQKLMGQYEDYIILDQMMSDVILNEPDYNWARTDITSDDIFYMMFDLKDDMAIMDSAFRKCATDFTGCTDNHEAQQLSSFNDVVRLIPFPNREYPRNCLDIQRIYGTNENKIGVSVYMSGDTTKSYKVSCTEMDTSDPKTYLDIYNTSGSTDTLSYNMAQYMNIDGSQVSSIYKKILVNVNYDKIEIINDQNDQQETTIIDETDTDESNYKQATLGFAVDCYANGAKSNVDLTGTNLVFDDSLSFVTEKRPLDKYEFVSTVMTWDEARSYAQTKGGDLLVIDSVDEYEAIKTWIGADSKREKNSWIGLKRTDKTKTVQLEQFQWVDSQRNLTSVEQKNYFHTGEPNNAGNNEDCVHYYWKVNSLNDLRCTRKLNAIIEYPSSILTNASGVNFDADRTAVSIDVTGEDQEMCTETKPTTGVISLKYQSN